MKLLKILLFASVLVVAMLYGFSFMLPTSINLEQAVLLNAKPEQVYPLLNNPTEWEKWSPVNKSVDPSMIRLYGGPLSGTGARMQWSGDRVGNGYVLLTESIAPGLVNYTENETEDSLTMIGSFRLEPKQGKTIVYWSQKTSLPDKPLARLKGFILKQRKQTELEEGLNRLRTYLDNTYNKKPAKRRLA